MSNLDIRRYAILLTAVLLSATASAQSAAPEARIAAPSGTGAGAAPGINQQFYEPDIGVWTQRFEGESREIYAQRVQIVSASGVAPGMTVADVGAGTGLFAMLFARAVEPKGRVIASDISKPFTQLILKRAAAEGLGNVSAVVATHTDTQLEKGSIDIVFTSDTYHHLERVEPVLTSIYNALRPGGRFIVVDFERIPGVTSQRTLNHVRASKETVMQEITAAGFRLREDVRLAGLKENYYLIFERP
jgi:predicted methyltransferase